MSKNQNPKLKFEPENVVRGLLLLLLVSIFGPILVDPTQDSGRFFYMFVAFITTCMFPWVRVVHDEEKK